MYQGYPRYHDTEDIKRGYNLIFCSDSLRPTSCLLFHLLTPLTNKVFTLHLEMNECSSNSTNNCHVNATCDNTAGGYNCSCMLGFTGDGRNCTDLNECLAMGCHANATCNNLIGSHSCACVEGFSGDGKNCTDVDECEGEVSETLLERSIQ